jgi:hypothetical protein
MFRTAWLGAARSLPTHTAVSGAVVTLAMLHRPVTPQMGLQAASWKITPRVNRSPARIRLTPCRSITR